MALYVLTLPPSLEGSLSFFMCWSSAKMWTISFAAVYTTLSLPPLIISAWIFSPRMVKYNVSYQTYYTKICMVQKVRIIISLRCNDCEFFFIWNTYGDEIPFLYFWMCLKTTLKSFIGMIFIFITCLINKRLCWSSKFSIKHSTNSVGVYKRPDFGFGNEICLSILSNFHYGWGIYVQMFSIPIWCGFSGFWIFNFKKNLTVESGFL